MRNSDDCNFGDLDASKSKYMMTYEHSSGEFVLKDIDTFLNTSPATSTVISEVLDEIDIDKLKFRSLDGGTFT
jgi:hypothetical protein